MSLIQKFLDVQRLTIELLEKVDALGAELGVQEPRHAGGPVNAPEIRANRRRPSEFQRADPPPDYAPPSPAVPSGYAPEQFWPPIEETRRTPAEQLASELSHAAGWQDSTLNPHSPETGLVPPPPDVITLDDI